MVLNIVLFFIFLTIKQKVRIYMNIRNNHSMLSEQDIMHLHNVFMNYQTVID